MAGSGREAEEIDEAAFARRGCCFFWVPQRPSSEPSPGLYPAPAEPWWRRALMKVREWSEVVAGPRWKTLIRRFNRANRRHGKFQYDPLSYALNFDEEDHACSNFSERFVLPPSHGRASSSHDVDAPILR